MEQIERIRHYEEILDRLVAVNGELERALHACGEAICLARELDEYYSDPLWRQDFEDDEAGLLPASLKRGVLSEDAAYDALEENRRLLRRLNETTGCMPNESE